MTEILFTKKFTIGQPTKGPTDIDLSKTDDPNPLYNLIIYWNSGILFLYTKWDKNIFLIIYQILSW